MDAAPARHRQPAGGAVHGRDLRLPPTGAEAPAKTVEPADADRPALPAEAHPVHLPPATLPDSASRLVHHPRLLGVAELAYRSARHKVDARRSIAAGVVVAEGDGPVDWTRAELLEAPAPDLGGDAIEGARYARPAAAARDPGSYAKWERGFRTWLRAEQPLVLYRSPALKAVSEPGETEGELRARLRVTARERRDAGVAKLRREFARKIERRLAGRSRRPRRGAPPGRDRRRAVLKFPSDQVYFAASEIGGAAEHRADTSPIRRAGES